MHATLDLAERISRISESSTMKVAAEADRLRREGIDVVDFGAGEPDFPTPDNIKRAAIAAIDANFTKYTPTGGTLELKQAICAAPSRRLRHQLRARRMHGHGRRQARHLQFDAGAHLRGRRSCHSRALLGHL